MGDEEQGMTPVGVSLPLNRLFPTYRHFNFLLGTARGLVERQPEAAIAVAQMAFESFTLFAIERMLRLRGIEPPLSERLSATVGGSMMDRPSRDLWQELVGRKINEAPDHAWRRYSKHVERRNQMVHSGGRASPEEASTSVDAGKTASSAIATRSLSSRPRQGSSTASW